MNQMSSQIDLRDSLNLYTLFETNCFIFSGESP